LEVIKPANNEKNSTFLKLCNRYFENRAENLGANVVFEGSILGAGISFYDYNNDGLDDITLAAAQNNNHVFLRNTGGFYVEDDLDISSGGVQAKQINWVDFDNDGDADFFAASDVGKCRLYRNDGDGVYTEISEESGIPQEVFDFFGASWGDGLDTTGFLSFCSAFFDYDKDGFQDVYIANDKFSTPNLLYHNNGDGTFESVGVETGTDLYMGAMSTTIDDYNHDGWLDVYVTNFFPPENDTGVVGNAFLLNNGDGTFTNVAEENGTRFDSTGWGAVFLDADNDTNHDLYVSGNISDASTFLEAAFYENQGDGNFIIPETAGFDGDDGSSFSNAIGDVDNDGYPEIIVMNNGFEEIYLWKNDTPQDNNWLKVKLEGTESNRMGIGSWIKISAGGQEQYHYTLCGEGYLAQNSAYEFFGLGDAETIDSIEVTWLSGQVDFYENIDANVSITIVEGELLNIEEPQIQQFQLFPNPAKGIVHINLGEIAQGVFRVYDTTGKVVLEKEVDQQQSVIDITTLSTGFYITRIFTDNGILTRKLVVN